MSDRGRKRSLEVTGGPAQAAARSMLRAMGWTSEDLALPQAGVAASWNKVTPCNMHLDTLAVAAGEELRSLDVLPLLFHTISVSDGIAMGTEGMRASLPSRDWIADSVELVMHAERMDGLLDDRGVRQDPARDDARDDQARPAVGIRIRRLDPAGLLPRQRRDDPGRLRGDRRARDREDEPRGPDGARVRRPARGRIVREHVHRQHDGERRRGARPLGARDGGPARHRSGARAGRAARGRGARRCARGRPAPVGRADEGLVRERDRRRGRARRLDERVPAPARARRRGGDRLRARRHRPHLAPHPADRRDAPGGPVHDAGPERRGRRPGRDARAARRRPDRRRRDDDDAAGRSPRSLPTCSAPDDPRTPVLRIGRRPGEADAAATRSSGATSPPTAR